MAKEDNFVTWRRSHRHPSKHYISRKARKWPCCNGTYFRQDA